MATEIRNKRGLQKYNIQPGDEEIHLGELFFVHKEGASSEPHSRAKKQSKMLFAWNLIKIGALIDALMLVSYLGWKPFGFFEFIAEPQIRACENILRAIGLL